jgi:hypothetical protein
VNGLEAVREEVSQQWAASQQLWEQQSAQLRDHVAQQWSDSQSVASQQWLETSEAMSQQWSDHQRSLSQQWQASQDVLENRFAAMTESLQTSMSELITVTTGASQANAELLSQLEQQVSEHRPTRQCAPG